MPEKLHTTVLELKTSEHCESKLMTILVELYTYQDDEKKETISTQMSWQ